MHRLKMRVFKKIMKIFFNLRDRYSHIPLDQPSLPSSLEQIASNFLNIPSIQAKKFHEYDDGVRYIDSVDLFRINGKFLPNIIESDIQNDWFRSPKYYPVYYDLYRNRHRLAKTIVRMLEIGVRTGYQGIVFGRATEGTGCYVGIDPNLYVKDGLHLAGLGFLELKKIYPQYCFFLYEGYSWESTIRNSLLCGEKFDLIHIDGDHTLRGKIYDLWLAKNLLAPMGSVLVDNYDHHPIIKNAIKCAMNAGWFQTVKYIETFRGLAILE